MRRAPASTADSMQYHGTADRYTLGGATAVATLYANATTRDIEPGRDAAQRRRAAAARRPPSPTTWRGRSSTRARATRRGPARSAMAWRRSAPTICSSAARSPTGSTSTRSPIPQADEQQRLLANLITCMNADRMPLPRFWYFPRGEKAVVVMTGDDHANNGTAGRFDQYMADSPAGLQRRRLGVRARHVLHLPEHADHRRAGRRLRRAGLRDRAPTSARAAPTTPPPSLADDLHERSDAVRRELPQPRRAADQPHALHRLQRLRHASRRWRSPTASGSTPTTTTGRGRGCRTGPAS